jgi:REP element-mobilizing transposase RayT
MVRGIEGRRIFVRDDDRRDFVARLGRLLPEARWRCFAWVLMPNHVHLVLQGSGGGLSRLMARLNTGYARGFNLRHDRKGYLFQNRFKSRLVDDDRDLMGLVLYVHRNPLASRLVDSMHSLERDPWCGHGALVGARAPRPFESVETTLALFAERPDEARRRVRTWMGDPDSFGFTGAMELAREERAGAARDAARCSAARATVHAGCYGRTIAVPNGENPAARVRALVAAVSRRLGVPTVAICSASPRRGPARARAAVAYLAVEQLGLSGSAVAATLGISASAVSHALRRGRSVAEQEQLHVVTTTRLPRS